MEHTKGKWEVSKMYDDGSVHIHGDNNKEYVCSVQIKQISGGAIAEAMESGRKANARLIATAPMLLGACRSALIEMQNVRPDIFRIIDTSEYDNTICVLGKAIASAEKS